MGAYYKLVQLPDEIRSANKIKSKARLFYDLQRGMNPRSANKSRSKARLFYDLH